MKSFDTLSCLTDRRIGTRSSSFLQSGETIRRTPKGKISILYLPNLIKDCLLKAHAGHEVAIFFFVCRLSIAESGQESQKY